MSTLTQPTDSTLNALMVSAAPPVVVESVGRYPRPHLMRIHIPSVSVQNTQNTLVRRQRISVSIIEYIAILHLFRSPFPRARSCPPAHAPA